MKKCHACGEQLEGAMHFCSFCGAKQEWENSYTEDTIKIENENTHVANESAVEDEGERYELPKQNFVKEEATFQSQGVGASLSYAKASKPKIPIVSLIRNSFILLVATLILISSFLPVNKLSTEERGFGEDIDINFGVNTIQQIILLVDSFKKLDNEELYDSELYEEMQEVVEEFNDYQKDDFENLSSAENKSLNKLLFLTLRLGMQSENMTVQSSLVVSVVFGVLYIIFAIAFFIYAIINLLSTIGVMTVVERKKLYRRTVSLLALAPAMLLATYYAGYMILGGKLSKMAVCVMIFSVIAIVATTVLRWIFAKREKLKVIIMRTVAVALCIAVFCLAFAPAFTASFKTKLSSGKITEIDLSYNAAVFPEMDAYLATYGEQIEEVKEATKQEKINLFEDTFEDYQYYSKKGATGELGKAAHTSTLTMLIGSKMSAPIPTLFAQAYALFVATVLATLVMLWQNLRFFATGEYSRKTVVTFTVLSFIFAITAVASVVVFVVMVKDIASVYFIETYTINISAGVIIMAVFTAIAMFVPSRIAPKQRKKKVINSQKDLSEQF